MVLHVLPMILIRNQIRDTLNGQTGKIRIISSANFNAQFFYSLTICLLHYYPRHVSSINMPIFRRKICIHTASGIFVLCKRLHSTQYTAEQSAAAWRPVKQLPSYHTHSATLPRSEPLPTTTTGHYTTCCKKKLRLALLKTGKICPKHVELIIGDQ